jgi:hypothetical protein
MIYLTISTEDLAALAVSSSIGSIALSAAIYFFKLAPPSESSSVTLTLAGGITIAAYLWFGGLVIRIRRRSGLPVFREATQNTPARAGSNSNS